MVNKYDVIRPTTDVEGLIRRIKKYVIETSTNCWILKKPYMGDGKIYIRRRELLRPNNSIYYKGTGKYLSIRRLSYLLTRGEIPNGKYVKNTCGVFGCVAPDHLKLSDNPGGYDD